MSASSFSKLLCTETDNSLPTLASLSHGVQVKVKIEYIGHIKNMTSNTREQELETQADSTIADLLDILSKQYGESFRKAIYEPKGTDIKPNYIVTINGYLLNQLKGLKTKLKNGDHVAILPIVSGG
jgi:MoaD family protein